MHLPDGYLSPSTRAGAAAVAAVAAFPFVIIANP